MHTHFLSDYDAMYIYFFHLFFFRDTGQTYIKNKMFSYCLTLPTKNCCDKKMIRVNNFVWTWS